MGQSESKKASKKAAGLETKGTAMSFGFMHKHKIHQSGTTGKHREPGGGGGTDGGSGTGTLKKPSTNSTNGNHLFGTGGGTGALEKEKAAERDNATVISNPGVDGIFSDKNGNMGLANAQADDGTTKATGRSTPRLQPPKKDGHGAPYRNNRFGFRSTNVVRPASVGLQPKTIADQCDKQQQHSSNNHNNNNNNNIHTTNNNNVYITDKRRSKSASAAASARTTFMPLQQAPSQVQQERASALQHHHHGGALHKPQPKYHHQSVVANPATKIAPPPSVEPAAMMTKAGDQAAEHKNTLHNLPPQQLGYAPTNGSQYGSAVDSGQQQQHSAVKIAPKPVIAAATSQEAAAKFTLHSSSLPKPQYPVPISLPSTVAGSSAAPPHYAMDAKGAKQAVNISRKGTLQGQQQQQRERSSDRLMHDLHHDDHDDDDDLDNPNVDTSSNIRMPRQRYRNLEMVMSGRHKFEVRDLETLTAEPIVALPLPKLPSAFSTTGQQQQPVPLSGLVRASELQRQLSDDIDINDNRYEEEQLEPVDPVERKDSIASSDVDVESLEEEKLMRDNNSSEKSLKGAIIKDLVESHCSKTSSPGSSRASWCNAGEAMAPKECSSLSLSSSDESNLNQRVGARFCTATLDEEDISSVTITAGNPSLMSSLSAAVPMDISNLDSVSEAQNSFNDNTLSDQVDSCDNKIFRTEENKFAEMALAVGDAILLDDETSPTDSLVSSCTESDDARRNRKKAAAESKLDKEKEKDIDEISPELEELTSPITPGTPTHASNSLSLSDGGRDFLIDDEIADQPALLFDEPALNDSSMVDLASIQLNLNEDTPTLQGSMTSLNRKGSGAPVPKPRKIMAETYESPASIRKNRSRLSRAESLDTLSPCDSITSDDFMLDFNSSMDSIDRAPHSNASGSASALHSMDELQLWSELENKGGQLMHEWSKLLRSQRNSNNNTSRESITSQLPARATRLLTRRLQNNATPTNCGTGGSESPRSIDSLPRRSALSASYKTATLNQFNNNSINGSCNMTDSASTTTNSAEDLTLLDKSLRNSMLQDVVHFKKQLVRLRRILQETDTLNPFENNNGQFFTTAAANNANAAASNATSGSPSAIDNKQQENTLIKESGGVALALLEDQRLELADLRRQVVYLQGEITAKDRTIRQQQNLIEKYEAEREKLHQSPASDGSGEGAGGNGGGSAGSGSPPAGADTISTATQTERLRPLSFGGPEGLASRSEPPSPSHAPIATTRNGLRSPATASSHHHLKPKTQISSVYTQLSSIKHSTHNGLHALPSSTTGTPPTASTPLANMAAHKRSSLGSNGNLCSSGNGTGASGASSPSNKTVRTTHIGNVLTSSKLQQNGASGPPSPTTPTSGSKLLKTSVRTQMNGGASPRLGHASHTTPTTPTTPKRMSAIKPPSSFASGTFPESAHKSRSAPATPMAERIPAPVQIVIESADGGKKQNGGCHEQQPKQNGGLRNGDSNNNGGGDAGNTGCDDDAGGDKDKEQQQQQVVDMEKDAINNKINSLKLANGLTGCNDSSCKENSLVI